MKERPSVYLVEKCDGLEKVIDFFTHLQGSYLKAADEKLLVFLHQIDFWDWEIENLIFSFDNFEERSRAWKGGSMAEQIGARHGILVKSKISDDADFNRKYRSCHEQEVVVAPRENLKVVVEKWNALLSLCEQRVMVSQKGLNTAIHYGAQVLPNLDKYRKKFVEQPA